MKINTNVSSLIAQESGTNVNINLRNSLEKLSSGLRINKASDDASGLAIADKLRTQASSLEQAVDNGNSAVTLLQIADRAMAEQSNILDIIKQKLIQASTATTSAEGMSAIGKDISKLLSQFNNIASQTNYNGIYLLQADGTDTNALATLAGAPSPGAATQLTFQMGEISTDTISGPTTVEANVNGMGIFFLNDLFLEAREDFVAANDVFHNITGAISTVQDFIRNNYMDAVDEALTQLNTWRSDYGSTQNQVDAAIRNMMTQITNIKAAESVIRDVDYAQESANFNKQNIIAQANTFALSQANNVSQNILRLLQ